MVAAPSFKSILSHVFNVLFSLPSPRVTYFFFIVLLLDAVTCLPRCVLMFRMLPIF